jgi:DNA-binding NarL/FixJ family response regulator
MNKLLVHNQKTILLEGLLFDKTEQFLFVPNLDTPDVDHYITAELEKGDLGDKIQKADVLFIKVALSENYLEYLGLRLAYHIRLSLHLGDKSKMPIIFVGQESYQFLALTADLADILFTKGVYLMEDYKASYESYLKMLGEEKIMPLDDPTVFVNKIRVLPPANYQTHHSIANEWSILRWADMAANIPEDEREKLRDHIKTTQTLYFKYLEAKSTGSEKRQSFPSSGKKKEQLYIPNDGKINAKIYYIDDEQDKGWGTLFNKFIFKEYTEAGRFGYFNDFPKSEERAELSKRLKEKVAALIAEGYNVFIIDLRLCDADFENKEELCGFELIREIKKINKGVQMVIFTASRKAENVNKAAEMSVNRYVLKESPENVLTRKESYALFVDFARQVKDAISKSFLAAFYQKIQQIKQTTLFNSETNVDKKDFRGSIVSKDGIPDKIFALTEQHTSLFLGEALLNAFKLLEKLPRFYFVGSGSVEDKGGNLIDVIADNGTQRSAKFEFKYGVFPFQTKQIATVTDIEFKEVRFSREEAKMSRDTESLTKMIAVLKFRFGLDNARLKKIIELRYLRSNLAAHDTGNVNTKIREIELDDVLFMVDLLAEVLI